MVDTVTITGQTKIFTPPADCSTSWTYEDSFYNSVDGGLLMQNLLPNQLDDGCFPKSFDAYGRAPSSIQVYSPAACPAGYGTPGAFNNAGTTTAICCPSNFSYYSTYSSINYFGSDSVLYQGCVSTFRGTTTVPARTDNTNLESTVVTGPLTMWGQPIIVQFQQEDLSLFPTTTSTSSSSSGTSSSPESTDTNSPNTNNNNTAITTTRSRFPTWARAVTGVGVVIAVLLIVGLAGFLIRRHRKKKAASSDPKGPYGYTAGQAVGTNMQQSTTNGPNGVYEFYSGNATDGRQEIGGKPVTQAVFNEMEGSSTPSGSVRGTTVGNGTGPSTAAGTGAGTSSVSNTSTSGVMGSWNHQAGRNARPVELE